MEEPWVPKDEEEADMLHSALAALSNVKAPVVNFILRRQMPSITWKSDGPPDMSPTPYYTIFRDPVGYLKSEDGTHWPILEIKMRGERVMLIVPELARIVAKTPTKAE